MSSTKRTTRRKEPRGEEQKRDSCAYGAPMWEHLAYGAGTALVAVGPALAGMEMITWMAVFMGINAVVLVALCLAGAWYTLQGAPPTSRRTQ